MINFINTFLLAPVDANGIKTVYWNMKQKRWTNNNIVIGCSYQVYKFKIK